MTDRETTSLERERLALEAARLIKDDTLTRAVANIRERAIAALIAADATNSADIIRQQAKVTVCDEFMVELSEMITMHAIETRSRFGE